MSTLASGPAFATFRMVPLPSAPTICDSLRTFQVKQVIEVNMPLRRSVVRYLYPAEFLGLCYLKFVLLPEEVQLSRAA